VSASRAVAPFVGSNYDGATKFSDFDLFAVDAKGPGPVRRNASFKTGIAVRKIGAIRRPRYTPRERDNYWRLRNPKH